MKQAGGFTIIQTMFILLIVGIVGSIAVKLIIDKRCEDNPARSICVAHKDTR